MAFFAEYKGKHYNPPKSIQKSDGWGNRTGSHKAEEITKPKVTEQLLSNLSL